MKALASLLLVPTLSLADCDLPIESIKPLVKETLKPLHEQANLLIEKDDFKEANDKIVQIRDRIDQCQIHHRNHEWDNYHFSRWGEKSSKYLNYSSSLHSITMQLEAAQDSYQFGIFRPLVFKVGMWEKVANDFYDNEI